jgi:AbiV family abortive infection protein
MTAPTTAVLTKSMKACIANGERLLDDADPFVSPPFEPSSSCTRLMLSMIAQEEFAKAFLLFLVREDIVPWSRELLRAMNDHACKHLVGAVVEYLEGPYGETMEEFRARIEQEVDIGDLMPKHVVDAMSVLRNEKIRRWQSKGWDWAEPPEYDRAIVQIAEGKRERVKQDAVYVRLGPDASVVSTPLDLDKAIADAEFKRAQSYRSCITHIAEYGADDLMFPKVREALRLLFKY